MQDGEVTLRGGPGDTQGRAVGRLRGGDRKSRDQRGDWIKRESVCRRRVDVCMILDHHEYHNTNNINITKH